MIRTLTEGERNLAASIYGGAIDYDAVTVKRSKWFPFQPRNILMAPTGHVHVHPLSDYWSADYSQERVHLQGLFLHELCHDWQSQRRGKYYLPLMRHPYCRNPYKVEVGREFARYGLEQQAEIVRHVHLLRHGATVRGAPPLSQLESILDFTKA